MKTKQLQNTIGKIKTLSKVKNREKINNISPEKIETIIKNIKAVYQNETFERKLTGKVKEIEEIYIKNWKQVNIFHLKKIINKLDPGDGIPVPVLTISGTEIKKTKFCKYLSYLLNPDNRHGLNTYFLDSLLGEQCREVGVVSDWAKNCQVECDYFLGKVKDNKGEANCTADICVIHSDFVIIIKHNLLSNEKSYFKDGVERIASYNRAISNNTNFQGKKKIKILLEESKLNKNAYKLFTQKNKDWCILTYGQIIETGIEVLKNNEFSKIAQENLVRFLFDLAIEPGENFREILQEIYEVAKKLIEEKFNLNNVLKFERLTKEHEKMLKIFLEVD